MGWVPPSVLGHHMIPRDKSETNQDNVCACVSMHALISMKQKWREQKFWGNGWLASPGAQLLNLDTNKFLEVAFLSHVVFCGCLVSSVPTAPKKYGFFELVYFQNLILSDPLWPRIERKFPWYIWSLQYLYMLASSHRTANLNKDVFFVLLDTSINSLWHYFSVKSVRHPWGLVVVSSGTSS